MLTLAVPVFNMASHLPRCMEAFLAQTCQDFEILLIDDGSTDGSSALCDAWAAAHPGWVRVVHKENGGLSSSRNAGIGAASGQYITFPDPDDWVEPDYVRQLLALRDRFDADLVCTGYFVDTPGSCRPAEQDRDSFVMTGPEAQDALLLPPRMGGFAWNKLYRLDIIRAQGLSFRDDAGTTEDLDFAYRYLACCDRVCCAPSVRTYHYFQHPDAATADRFSPKKADSLRTYERILADCAQRSPALAEAAREELCTAAVNLIWMHGNAVAPDPALKKTLLRQIRRYLPACLRGRRYGIGRKAQAILAACSPRLYTFVKNAVRKG